MRQRASDARRDARGRRPVTQAEWMTCAHPDTLIHQFRSAVGFRKAMLLAVACRRRVAKWEWFSGTAGAVETAERWADGGASEDERELAYREVYNAREAAGRMILSDLDDQRPSVGNAGYLALEAVISLLVSAEPPELVGRVLSNCRGAVWFGDMSQRREDAVAEAEAQAGLFRDIFGNPFRPVAFSPEWRTDTAVSLARGCTRPATSARCPFSRTLSKTPGATAPTSSTTADAKARTSAGVGWLTSCWGKSDATL